MTRSLSELKVLIGNGDYDPSLECARLLGKKGIPVVIADEHSFCIAAASKYTTFKKIPSLFESKAFIASLIAIGKRGEANALLPTSDMMLWYASSRRSLLQKYYRMYIPSVAATQVCLFKKKTHQVCMQHGIGTPVTYFPTSPQELRVLSKKMEYPAIIKHRTNIGFRRHGKGKVIANAEQLLRAYQKDTIIYDATQIKKVDPHVEWPMIQEYIPDALNNLYTVQGISSQQGKRALLINGKKMRQRPPKLGVGVCSEPSYDKGAVREVQRFLKAIKYDGIFGIEVIYDTRNKRYKIIDANPRPVGLTGLATANGLDLMTQWLACLSSKHIRPKIYYGKTRLIHLVDDLLYMPGNIIHARRKLHMIWDIIRSYGGAKKFAVASWHDPKPLWVDILNNLWGKVRRPHTFIKQLVWGE